MVAPLQKLVVFKFLTQFVWHNAGTSKRPYSLGMQCLDEVLIESLYATRMDSQAAPLALL